MSSSLMKITLMRHCPSLLSHLHNHLPLASRALGPPCQVYPPPAPEQCSPPQPSLIPVSRDGAVTHSPALCVLLLGTDPEETILHAFKVFDTEGKGFVKADL